MFKREDYQLVLANLGWAIPVSLALGALLSFLGPGFWLIGWLSFSLLMLAGLLGLAALRRWAGGGRTLAWIIAVAFLVRLLSGAALALLLPVGGYDDPVQRGGYVFFDAYRRDGQAWELARSAEPVWRALDKSYSTDQYGGLLGLSALTYRYLSPDAQRPLLIVLLAALAAAGGVAFLWKIARQIGGDSLAVPAAWIFALYPEGVLQGASQMREPFLITFVAMAFWGLIEWQAAQRRTAWAWLALGFAGMLLFSPGIALLSLIIFAGWLWFSRPGQISTVQGAQPGGTTGAHGRASWQLPVIAIAVFAVALALFIWGASRQVDLARSLNLKQVADWFNEVAHWDTLELKRGSGWVQKLFSEMDGRLKIPFVTIYGITQPVLPAALIEPTVPLWRAIGLLRAAGWYLLVPFLLYGFVAAWQTPDRGQRRLWLWLEIVVWAWIVICAARAGGDQWDNPRYRVILLAMQALLAAHAWTWSRTHRGPGLMRILVVEAIFLALFTEWYLNRYSGLFFQMPFFGMVAAIVGLSLAFLLASVLWERRRPRQKGRP